jgi:hypothetical protein
MGASLWAIFANKAQYLSRDICYNSPGQYVHVYAIFACTDEIQMNARPENYISSFVYLGDFESSAGCQNFSIGTTVPKGV